MAAKKKVSRFQGLKAITIGPQERVGGTKAFAESRQIKDPFTKTAYRKFKLETPPLGPNSLERLADLLLEDTDFAVCCSQIAIDVTGLGYHFVPFDKDNAPEADRKKLEDFFGNCNPDYTFDEICYNINLDLESLGNGYMEVTREGNQPGGVVQRLDHIPGREVRITKDLKNFIQVREGKHAWFRRFGSDPDEETSKDPDTGEVLNEAIWFMHYHPSSRVYGIPRVVPALAAVMGNRFQQDRNLKFFYNKAIPEWCLMIKGDFSGMTPEEEAELEEFRQNIQNHLELVLRGEHYRLLQIEVPQGVELEWKMIGVENKDADFRKYYKDNRDQIVRSYSMMPHRIGIIESGNIGGGTGETQIETYKASVPKPRQEKWEKKMLGLIRRGLSVETFYMKWDEIDSIDEAREAEILGRIGPLPFLSVNDGRAWISKFLKMPLEPLAYDWADYPFPVIATQLAMMNLGLTGKTQLPEGLFTGDMPGIAALMKGDANDPGMKRIYDRLQEVMSGAGKES